MDNFFRRFNKSYTNATYHNPYKYLSVEDTDGRTSKRIGDFDTTLWLETAGLILFMSLTVLLPTLF